eukprot:TRINITY_DN3179_c0_g1_i1.p1 TRINITY_DN3179_c0_g1~~TRINITY_DN3179_c0_g1_i1.p1  ORF type:complete len:326 (+),score=49.99 TRINITY_DN3179_c0_g1_i1:468-1445(+)
MAAKRPTHVPKFGGWDANDHMPYTAVFDSARAGKGSGGKPFNPNDPADNPEAFYQRNDRVVAPPVPQGPAVPAAGRKSGDYEDAGSVHRGRHERKNSREEVDYRRPAEAPRNPYGNPGGNPYSEAPRKPAPEPVPSRAQPEGRQPPRMGAGAAGGPARTGSGSVNGVDRTNGDGSSHGSSVGSGRADASPVHPHAYQQRHVRPGGNSPARGPGEPAFAPATPNRSRMGPGGRPTDTPDRSTALPKFGEWDSKNPNSGDGFTVIFDQAMTEKKMGGVPGRPSYPADLPARRDEDLYKTPGRGDKAQKTEPKWYHSLCPCMGPAGDN